MTLEGLLLMWLIVECNTIVRNKVGVVDKIADVILMAIKSRARAVQKHTHAQVRSRKRLHAAFAGYVVVIN